MNFDIAGTIPGGWGIATAFSALVTLDLSGNTFMGTVPQQWGMMVDNNDVFPALQFLDLSSNRLSGYLPAPWGTGFKVIILEKASQCHHFLPCMNDKLLSKVFTLARIFP